MAEPQCLKQYTSIIQLYSHINKVLNLHYFEKEKKIACYAKYSGEIMKKQKNKVQIVCKYATPKIALYTL